MRCGLMALLIASTLAESAHASEAPTVLGRALAERHCATCHGIGRMDDSPLDEAPPFGRLREHYPIETLAEAFAEGIAVGHKDMPAFTFSPQEIDALLSYIDSLARGARRRR